MTQKTISFDQVFKHSPVAPYDPYFRGIYGSYVHGSGYQPYEYTGWRNETNSWKESCYIHSGLNPTQTFSLKGPEALTFLSDHCINSFKDFPVGKGKHGIICNDDGLVIQDGIILRISENEFITYWMMPYLPYCLGKGKYNITGENLTGSVFLFQLCGPRSLEIVEAATGEDLHDIKFIQHRMSTINGIKVRILRVGMGGSLGYEVHGQIEDAIPVYNALIKAGEAFDLRRLGMRAYNMTHYEGGFPQYVLDFLYPYSEDKEFTKWLEKAGIGTGGGVFGYEDTRFKGSMGTDKRLRYRTPFDLGWGGMIKFDHDFPGRAALEKLSKNPPRKMVTLEWNTEDIVDIYRSQFEPGEPFAPMDEPDDFTYFGNFAYHADKVLKDGRAVGISTGRMNDHYYRKMISLCSINIEFSEIGTDVVVLWGEPGTRQKEIRAKVARYPYIDIERNEKVDVNKIPRPGEK